MLSHGRRTPPGVRELKRLGRLVVRMYSRRTPPGVRELKPMILATLPTLVDVAPLPGCVN